MINTVMKGLFCDLCNVKVTSEGQLSQHLQGKSHQKHMKNQSANISNVQITPVHTDLHNSVASTSHFDSKETRKNEIPRIMLLKPGDSFKLSDAPSLQSTSFLAQTAVADPVAHGIALNLMGVLPKHRKKEITCDVCKISLESEVSAKAHFDGKRHKKKKQQIEFEQQISVLKTSSGTDPLYCMICNIHVNCLEQMEIHTKGAKHVRKASGTGPPIKTPLWIEEKRKKAKESSIYIAGTSKSKLPTKKPYINFISAGAVTHRFPDSTI